jgi:DNA-binding HxlR family transcriptional regulator
VEAALMHDGAKSMDTSDELESLATLALTDMPRIRPVLGKITDKWAVMILTVLCPKPARFNEIKRRLEGNTHKALADALKRLERNGLVTRTVLATAPVAVEYHITPLGLSLREPFEALCRWAAAHGDEVERAAGRYDEAKARQAA